MKKAQIIMRTTNIGMQLFLVFFLFIIALVMLNKFIDIGASSDTLTTEAKTGLSTAYTRMTNSFNWVGLILYVGLILISVVGVRTLNFGLVKFLIFILMVSFIIIMLAVPSNIYDEAKTKVSEINDVASDVNIIDYILTYLVQFGLVYFLIVSVAAITRKDVIR